MTLALSIPLVMMANDADRFVFYTNSYRLLHRDIEDEGNVVIPVPASVGLLGYQITSVMALVRGAGGDYAHDVLPGWQPMVYLYQRQGGAKTEVGKRQDQCRDVDMFNASHGFGFNLLPTDGLPASYRDYAVRLRGVNNGSTAGSAKANAYTVDHVILGLALPSEEQTLGVEQLALQHNVPLARDR